MSERWILRWAVVGTLSASLAAGASGQAAASAKSSPGDSVAAAKASVTAKSVTPNGHWVATWGTAQNPARIVAALPALVQPAAAAPSSNAATASVGAPVPAAPAAQSSTAPAIPLAPQMAPRSSVVARRYNLPPAVAEFNNQTVRMSLRTSIGGSMVRIRLYNAYGATTVKIGAVHIAVGATRKIPMGSGSISYIVPQPDTTIDPSTDRALTFSGKPTATLYGGEVLTSDPVKLNADPLSNLVVSLYLPQKTGAPTTHALGLREAYTAGPGDYTAEAKFLESSTTLSYYWLEGVDVMAPASAAAVVTFGDSITDGDQSTPGADAMWPAVLARRLHEDKVTAGIAVVNEGISGNRVLGDNVSALARFEHEALDVPGVKWVTIMEGINDINLAMRATPANTDFSAEDLIAAYRQMIAAAHSRGVKVIGCTMTPYGGSSGYKDAGEAIREAANDWIRKSGEFDYVVDFDAVTRDKADPKRFSEAAESPDLLHPGDGGYKIMGEAVPLAIFEKR